MTGILSGLRVLDWSAGQAGRVASLLLAEAGAEVVAIEPPAGDPLRGSPAFAVWGRSKTSIALDPATAEGRDRLQALLAGADILVHDRPRQELAGLALGDADLARDHPHLIVTAIATYPEGHPLADLPVDDALVLAASGICDEQRAIRREGPVYLRFPLASWGAAWLAVCGVLARLVACRRGLPPGPVRTSLIQGALMPMAMYWYEAERPSASLAAGLPKDADISLFECSDGVWLHLMTNADLVPLMRDAIAALPEALRQPSDNPSTFHKLFPLLAANRAAFRTRPSGEWLEALWAHDIAVQPALELGELYRDQQARENDYVVAVDDPSLGPTFQPAVPFAVSPPARVRSAAQAAPGTAMPDWSPRTPPAEGASPERPRAPLEGIRILDLGNFLAGPFAAMLAADLGAEVIKLEAGSGDQMRWIDWGFNGCQRGKRSIALELKNPKSRPILERLVREADVVHHNLRMPAARKLGIDYETLRQIRPDLIYCHVSSYGPRGPRRHWPGYDQLFQASGGWEVASAGEGNPPIWNRFGMLDHQGALASLMATLLALHHRERTGEGQCVNASLLAATLFTASEAVLLEDGRCTALPQLDAQQTGCDERRRLYRCMDGWIMLDATAAPDAWARLKAGLGYGSSGSVEGAFAQHACTEALALAAKAGALAVEARQNQRAAFFADPATWDAGLAVAYPHPRFGMLKQVGRFWAFGNLATRIDRAPPLLGEHSAEILRELGFASNEVENFLAEGVVVGPP